MYKNLLNLLVLAVLLPSCSGTAPHISVVCEENNVGNCIVKWEMAPLIKGNIKVSVSYTHLNLSIIDLLFNMGPESLLILQQSNSSVHSNSIT